MKYLFLLIFISIVSCSTNTLRTVIEIPIQLKTSNEQLKLNFDSCLRLTRQLIRKKISEKEFYEYFRLDTRATGFEYDNVVLSTKDTLYQLPKSYQIYYEFIYKDDTISTFWADFDSTIKNTGYGVFRLDAFRKFIDKKLIITKSNAKAIAIRNGMRGENFELILCCETDKSFWKCTNDCDGCLFLEIDARTGNIIGQGKVIYQY